MIGVQPSEGLAPLYIVQAQLRPSLEPLEQLRTMASRGTRAALIWAPIAHLTAKIILFLSWLLTLLVQADKYIFVSFLIKTNVIVISVLYFFVCFLKKTDFFLVPQLVKISKHNRILLN